MENKKINREEDKVLNIITSTLDDMKAEDVVVIDLEGKTSLANQMVVASGTSNRHVLSIAQKIEENLKNNGCKCSVEGETKADWILIDAFDVIVHIFHPDVREYYNIEKMWNSIANLRKE